MWGKRTKEPKSTHWRSPRVCQIFDWCHRRVEETKDDASYKNLGKIHPLRVLQNCNLVLTYRLLLNRYKQTGAELQVSRLELQQKKEISAAKSQFEKTCELLDYCNGEVPEIKRHRKKWATGYFTVYAIPYLIRAGCWHCRYAIWLAFILIVAFGQGSNARSNSYWFSESIKDQFVRGARMFIFVVLITC